MPLWLVILLDVAIVLAVAWLVGKDIRSGEG